MSAVSSGGPGHWPESVHVLFEEAYPELRRIAGFHMRAEPNGHTWQPTALVNEAFARMVARGLATFQDREHFLATAAVCMRHALVDHARGRLRQKRGGGDWQRVPLMESVRMAEEHSEMFLALDQALTRLAAEDPRLARVFELRFYLGLTLDEAAETLGCAFSTIKRLQDHAVAWLRRELDGEA